MPPYYVVPAHRPGWAARRAADVAAAAVAAAPFGGGKNDKAGTKPIAATLGVAGVGAAAAAESVGEAMAPVTTPSGIGAAGAGFAFCGSERYIDTSSRPVGQAFDDGPAIMIDDGAEEDAEGRILEQLEPWPCFRRWPRDHDR